MNIHESSPHGLLTQALGLSDGGVAAVVGCGGKTALIRLLADENQGRAVLITPTTRMYPMQGAVGVYQAATGKLSTLPARALRGLAPAYDLCLLEADGSRGLPCKGWRADEPVVPDFCTHTIGVVTLRGLGRPADDETCLRLPLFLSLTGLAPGAPITLDALARMVCAPGGMFQHSRGRRYLFVNQIEDGASEALAARWLGGIRAAHPGRFDGLLLGSLHAGRWTRIE